MPSQVTITSTKGRKTSYPAFGRSELDVLAYASALVRLEADLSDGDAKVTITRDGRTIAAPATVGAMLRSDL